MKYNKFYTTNKNTDKLLPVTNIFTNGFEMVLAKQVGNCLNLNACNKLTSKS
jgi:hypothetical protein